MQLQTARENRRKSGRMDLGGNSVCRRLSMTLTILKKTLPSGDAQVDWKEGLVLFDDIHSSPSLWRYHDYTRIRMFYISSTRAYGRIRNVRFAEGGRAVVCGSDHGLVYIFDLQTGKRLQKLDIGTNEWVQVVVVRCNFQGSDVALTANTLDWRGKWRSDRIRSTDAQRR